MIKYEQKSMIKLFFSLDFGDDFHKDPLTGGNGHLDGIKAHLYYDYFSNELWSIFYIHDSIPSREIQSCCLNFQIHKVNTELDL